MRIIIDTDPGNGIPGADVDDALAIGLALRSPEVQLEAITVVAGNVSVDRGVDCVLEVLEAAGATHVPVHRGAARPLVQDPTAWRALLERRRDDEDAQRLWRDVHLTPARKRPAESSASKALVDLVNASPGEITVVAIGPLTNLAMAMALDEDWADKVKQIVVMGGAFNLPGVLQELNAAYDPEATHRVLSSRAPMLLVPLDVTLQTFMRHADIDRLDEVGTPLATYLGRTVRPWVTWLAKRFDRDGCPLHDALTLAALIDPGVVTTREAAVDIELRGSLTRGRTVSWGPDDEETLAAGLHLPEVRQVSIASDVDNDRFMKLLLDRLTAA